MQLPSDPAARLDLVHAALADAGLLPGRVRRLLDDGWDYLVADVDAAGSRYMLRFPRRTEVAEGMPAEARLLKSLAAAVSFAVPAPEHAGTARGVPFTAYRRVAGRPFRAEDDVRAVGSALRELHAFPVRGPRGCSALRRTWAGGWTGNVDWPPRRGARAATARSRADRARASGARRLPGRRLERGAALPRARGPGQ